MKKIQVSYLGLNSLFGRVTTNLLKQSPCIEKLSIYDDDNASLLEGETNVFVGRDQLPDAVKDVDIVVIGDGPCDTHEDRLKVIGPKIIRYTEAILTSSPNAIIVVAASPLNILVPLVGHFLGPDWQNRLIGVTSVDTLRASRILNGLLNNPQQAHILPVLGGSSASSRVPLFSHLHPKTVLRKDIREKIMEKMKFFDNTKYREMDSVERAYSAVRFIHSVMSGMLKDTPIPEIAMTKTTEVPNAEFCSLPMLLGKNGIENALQLPKFDDVEERLFLEATEILAEDSRKARDFINSLAQESVRNVNTNRDISVGKRLVWNQRSESSGDSNLEGEEFTDGGTQRKTPNTAEMASIQRKSLTIKREIRKVSSEDNNSALPITVASSREARPLTYSSLAKPCGSEEAGEMQKSNRKSIPIGPAYQLVPEPKRISSDFRKLPEGGKPIIDSSRNNKVVELIDSETSLLSVEDVSPRGCDVWRSPTTALETYHRTETLKENDVPQPSSIQNLVPEVIKLGSALKTDSHSQKRDQNERSPSLADSDISSPDSDCTETLMKQVDDHLGDISKYAGSSPPTESRESEIVCRETNQLIDGRLFPVEDHENDKQDLCSESTELAMSSNDNEIATYNSSQNNTKAEVDVQVLSPRPQVVEHSELSDLNDSQKLSKNELVPNYESIPEYLHRDCTKLTDVLNGKTKGTKSTTLECEPIGTQHQTKYLKYGEPDAPLLQSHVDKKDIRNCLHEKFKPENKQIINLDSEDMVRKRWKEKLSDETMWASSVDVIAFNNRKKKNSMEWGRKSVDVKYILKSRRPVNSDESLDQNTKDRYPVGFPGIRYTSNKPVPSPKTVASEERILCLMENRLRKKSVNDSVEGGLPKKQEWSTLQTLSLKSSISPEGGLSKSEMLLRSKLKANSSSAAPVLPGLSFNRRIVKDLRWSTNDDGCVSANLLAAKGRDTESSALVTDVKKDRHESGECHSSQTETTSKLLNLPGCKHRYDTSLKILKHDEKCNDAVEDVHSVEMKTDLTSDQTKRYFMRQKRGTIHLDGPKKLHSRKRSRTQKEIPKPKRKSVKSSSQLAEESKKEHRKSSQLANESKKEHRKSSQLANESKKEHRKSSQLANESKKEQRKSSQLANESKKENINLSGKQATRLVSQSGAFKKSEQNSVSKATSNKNMTNQKKIELTGVPKRSSDSLCSDNEWESKYFTKASEMFFRMFRESVTSNNASFNCAKTRMSVRADGNKYQDANASLPGVSSIQPVSSNINDSPRHRQVEVVKVNWNLPPQTSTDVHSGREINQLDGKSEKPENNKMATISEIKNAKTLKASIDNDENMRSKRKMGNGLKVAKALEGLSVNKLNMLHSPGGNIGIQTPSEENRGTENSVFKSKVTGMEKYQIEKNYNMKKEFKLNASSDVDKLFEESSTIPFHISSASDGKMWNATTRTDKGGKPSYSRQQSTLQEITATSDKGKGDAVNMIDFNICKSPMMNDQQSMKCEAPKHSSSVNNGYCWRPPIAAVPISSKNIKQVNPQNYREHILNSYGRKANDETPRAEKSNKWERILTVFKQIIIRDLEDKIPDSEATNSLNKPAVQFGTPMSKVTHASLKSTVGGNPVPNQKVMIGKTSSKVKKKKEILKKKQPAESMRRSLVIKNNPKKIVNYFSKRGNSSSYEKPSLTNFTVSSFAQTPGFFNEHLVNIEKHK